MRISVTRALRAELSRARSQPCPEPLALFVLGLGDDGDISAWALAYELAPERLRGLAIDPLLVVGAVSLPMLANTLQRAGERELSAALRSSAEGSVPVVLLRDVVRMVKGLDDVEADEVELLLRGAPAGQA